MKTKKQLLQSIKREYKLALYNASINLDRHNCLHPDCLDCGHQLAEYQDTWLKYLEFSKQDRSLKEKYKDVKKSYKLVYFC